MLNRTITFLLTAFLPISVAVAETIYVAQSAAGADDGSSAANAKSISWFNTSGNWGAGAGKVSAGDSVILTGTISTALDVPGSGSSGSPVTITFDTGAKISSASWGGNWAVRINTKSWITIEGPGIIEQTDAGFGLGATNGGYCVYIVESEGIRVSGITGTNWFYRPAGHASGTAYGNNIRVEDSTNVVVNHCDLGQSSTMLYLLTNGGDRSEGIQFLTNTLRQANNAILVGDGGASAICTNVVIRGNSVQCNNDWSGATFHIDGIHVFAQSAGSRLDSLVVDRNTIGPDMGADNDITAWLFVEGLVYAPMFTSNIFTILDASAAPANGFIYDKAQSGIVRGTRILHNTIISKSAKAGNGINAGEDGVIITDNALVNCNYTIYSASTPTNFATVNYNLHHNFNSIDGNASFANWQSSTGSPDANGLSADPLFDADGNPSSGSPVIGAASDGGDIGALAFAEGFTPTISTNNAGSGRVAGFRGLRMEILPLPVSHNHPASPLLFEDFEASGYTTAGWASYLTGTGNSINPDNTTNVLSGSQSFALVGISDDPSYATNSFTASSEVFGYLEFKCLKYPSEDGDAYRQILRLEKEDGTPLFNLMMFNTGVLYIQTGGTSDGATAFGALTLGQTYYIWFSWDKNNGSNSAATMSVSTTKVRPTSGDGFVSITGTTIADDATRLMIGYDNTSNDGNATFNGAPSWIYDYVILDDVEIQSYP